MKISLIIPTYKRPKELFRALSSLKGQTLRDCEVLIIDNAPSPEIEQMVSSSRESYNIPLKYFSEPKLGLHYARHAGAISAKGDVLVFSDDDATFEAGWLEAYAKSFADNPQMAAAGGPVRPVWEATPPRWLKELISQEKVFWMLSLMEPDTDFTLSSSGFFFGVNMAIRRSILFEVGGFNPEMFGDEWLGDGETGLTHKLWERDMLVGYVPEAMVYHFIPGERMTVEYFRKRMANEGACDMYTRFHKRMPGRLGLLTSAASVIVRNAVLWVFEPAVTGRTDRFSLRVQLQTMRSHAQLRYISRPMHDSAFRSFVRKTDWLESTCTSA